METITIAIGVGSAFVFGILGRMLGAKSGAQSVAALEKEVLQLKAAQEQEAKKSKSNKGKNAKGGKSSRTKRNTKRHSKAVPVVEPSKETDDKAAKAIAQKNEELKKVQEELTKKGKELKKAQEELTEKREELTAKEADIDKSKSEIAELKKARDASTTDSAELQAAKDKLSVLQSERESEQASAKQALLTYKEGLDALQKDLDAAKQANASTAKTAAATSKDVKGDASVEALNLALANTGVELNPILDVLVRHENLKAALLADINGIPIAKSGEADSIDSLAAVTNALVSIPQQLGNLVPLNNSFCYRMYDNNNAIVGQTFESAGERIALTTMGNTPASESALRSTVNRLNAALK